MDGLGKVSGVRGSFGVREIPTIPNSNLPSCFSMFKEIKKETKICSGVGAGGRIENESQSKSKIRPRRKTIWRGGWGESYGM